MTDIQDIRLPTLEELQKNGLPPRVEFTADGKEQAMKDKKRKQALLDVKRDSEQYVKRILLSVLSIPELVKDGDFMTFANGQKIWRKRTADYQGTISLTNGSFPLYVEVKGCSPGKSFALARLDKRNNPRQPSQHEKLTEKAKDKKIAVFLALVFWDSEAEPAQERPVKWLKRDCQPRIFVVNWRDWLKIKWPRRSVRREDLSLLANCEIVKVSGRWQLYDNHWLTPFLPEIQIALPF